MRMRHAAVVAGLALGLMSPAARAAVTIDFNQTADGVIATGGGSLDLGSVTGPQGNYLQGSLGVNASSAYFNAGGSVGDPLDAYSGFSGPSSFGPGGMFSPSATTGDIFAFNGQSGQVFFAQGYQSNNQLAFSDIFAGQSFSSLGLTQGHYTFESINGESADRVVINIGDVSAVPLPASAPMFGAALLALGAIGYGVKRKKAAAAA